MSGKAENEQLKLNLESQLNRLVEQLADLEKEKDELGQSEYEEMKQDTIDQLKELNESLEKLLKGDISLVTTLGAIRLATQTAISQAFNTPEVLCLFGKKDVKQLRKEMQSINEQVRLNKLSLSAGDKQKADILVMLRQLNEQLSKEELQFLEKHKASEVATVDFIKVDDLMCM